MKSTRVPHSRNTTERRLAYPEPFSVFGQDLAQRRHDTWVKAVNRFYLTSFDSEMKVESGLLYYTSPWSTPSRRLRAYMAVIQVVRWFQGKRISRKFDAVVLPEFIESTNMLGEADISDLGIEELIDGLDQAVRTYIEFQFDSLPVGKLANMSASILKKFCEYTLGKNGAETSGKLLAGLENLSIKRDQELQKLAHSLRANISAEDLNGLDYDALRDIESRSTALPFWKELSAFEKVFGYIWADRYPRDPAWRINPEAVANSLMSATVSVAQRHAEKKFLRRGHIEQIRLELSDNHRWPWNLLLNSIFQYLLTRAEIYFPYKENRNHYVYIGVLRIQRYAREIGRHLAEAGILSSVDDVFFLEWSEIQKYRRKDLSDTYEKIARRKKDYENSLRQVKHLNRSIVSRHTAGGNIRLLGTPCSPHVATGPARNVQSMNDLSDIRMGDILVCRDLRPAWSSVFSLVAGIVVERGGALSHGATLAREYGLPAVMNVQDVMGIVRTFDQLVVDGNKGIVTVMCH